MMLVINAGSSSIKTVLFDANLDTKLKIDALEIGGESRLSIDGTPSDVQMPDHRAALSAILDTMADMGNGPDTLDAAAHRVVHGGATLTTPVRLTEARIEQIRQCIPLAPLHNPANVAGIEALSALAPDLPQFASFDTAFHANQPDVATRYPLPPKARTAGLRRYGFHGLSYASLVESMQPNIPKRLLACHLGNGASLCAILDGRSVATTMGYSPLAGLSMGTRTGDMDPGAVLHLARMHGIDETETLLNRSSGLTGLAGTNDMAVLLQRHDPDAEFAVAHYCYWITRHAGSMIAAMGGLDAIAFTGGVGENAVQIRDRVTESLAWANASSVSIVPAEEEKQIARDAQRLMAGGG